MKALGDHTLTELAVRRLCAWPTDELYPFTWKRRAGAPPTERVEAAGASLRYSAVALVGLKSVELMLARVDREGLASRAETLFRMQGDAASVGDLGLVSWALGLVDPGLATRSLARLRTLLVGRAGVDHYSPYQACYLSWAIDGVCACLGGASGPERQALLELAGMIGDELVKLQDDASGLFRRSLVAGRLTERIKQRVAFFCDQVYPIHALSSLALTLKDERYASAAEACAKALRWTQGADGQWCWVYRVSDGMPLELYPVYSVHQHGMGPMAFRQLGRATGVSYAATADRSLAWLAGERHAAQLVAHDESLVWRSVRRARARHLHTTVRSALGAAGWAFDVRDTAPVAVDHECRPYELGWLLYASSLGE